MLDRYITGTASRLSPEAPVPVILYQSNEDRPGGAANVALNLVAMGCDVTLVGVIGEDAEGELLLSLLLSPHIDTSNIEADSQRPTTSKTRIMAGAHQVARVDREIASDVWEHHAHTFLRLVRKMLRPESIGGHPFDAVVFSDYAKGVVTEDLVRKAVENARFCGEDGIPVIVDPKRKDFRAYKGATLITPNVAEIQLATGKSVGSNEEASTVAQDVAERYECSVLLTRSEKGMLLCDKENGLKTMLITSRPVSVSDVSGAGDTVVAAVAAGLARGLDLEAACRHAEVAAEIAVSKPGTSIVTEAEIIKREAAA
ncbi:hypothetical protein AD930_10790 [Acetobacter malorum]|nr:hypothetical protein AD930_10790 [Acetobacter malorum]